MIRNLFFDVDDTLLDFHKSEANALKKTLRAMQIEPTDAICARYSAINASYWKKLERGEITREALLTARFEELYSTLAEKRDAFVTQSHYERALANEHSVIDGAEETLELLVKSGSFRLFAVTNGTSVIQRKRMSDAGIWQYFEDVFISQEIGAEKPSGAFFDACFAKYPDLVRGETMIIGDSLSSDIRGGMNASLVTCWFHPHQPETQTKIPSDIRIDYELTALRALPSLCLNI